MSVPVVTTLAVLCSFFVLLALVAGSLWLGDVLQAKLDRWTLRRKQTR